jgi:trigger factor
MKSTVDKLDGLSRKLNIEIPAEKVQQAFDKVYKALQKNANIKGFRPGKAPISTIKSVYSDRVKNDVVNELVNEAYQAALEEHKMDPVGYPKISFQPVNEDAAFEFSAELEVRPEVQVKNFENLPVLKEKLDVPDQRVEEVLNNIRSSQAETVTVFEDRAVANGDVAEVDFVGTINGGQELPNGSAQGHQLEIGAKQFIDGFEEGVVGMKVGDSRTLNLNFPEGYHEATLSGAAVRFEVKLVAIKKKSLPELNDELAKKAGPFESLEALKTQVRKDIEHGEEKRILDEMRNRVVKALVDANPVEAPRSLVDQQKEALMEDFKGRMSQQGMNDADFIEYKKKWDKEFEESATFMVKSTFLLDNLAEKLDLRAKPSEVEAKIQEYAQQTGIEMDRLNDFYNKPERRSRLFFQVTEEKVVNHLVSKAKVTEVTKDQLPAEAT